MSIINRIKRWLSLRKEGFNPYRSPMVFQTIQATEPTVCKIVWKDTNVELKMDQYIYLDNTSGIVVIPASETYIYITWPIDDSGENYAKEIPLLAKNPKKSLIETANKLKSEYKYPQ